MSERFAMFNLFNYFKMIVSMFSCHWWQDFAKNIVSLSTIIFLMEHNSEVFQSNRRDQEASAGNNTASNPWHQEHP